MHPWQNPFAEKQQKEARPIPTQPEDDVSEDEDSSQDQVVYHEDHLANLLSLYTRANKNEREKDSGREVSEQAHGPSRMNEDACFLQRADAFCMGATQISQYHAEIDWGTDALEVAYNGEVSNSVVDEEEDDARASSASPTSKISTSAVEENCVASRDSWDVVLEATYRLGDVYNERKGKSVTGGRSWSRNNKGTSKQKLRFSFGSVMKATCLQEKDKRQSISLAEQLQNLTEANDSSPYGINNVSRKGKLMSSARCPPVVEQLRDLLDEDPQVPHLQDQPHSCEPTMVKHFECVATTSRRMLNSYEDITESGNSDEDGNIGTGPLDSDATISAPIPQILPAPSMNELFQEALQAASEANEGCHVYDRLQGPVFGFTARLLKVLQHEKNQRVQFMKALQIGQSPHDKGKCLELQILGRNLEARLATCTCKVLKSPELSRYGEKYDDMVVIAIFNARTSTHLELEVGNAIRIHPPWQEMSNIPSFSKTILCTHFCEMMVQIKG